MKLYRGIQGQYINPKDFARERKALDIKFNGLEKLTNVESKDNSDFVNWVRLRQAKRLGHFGTNRTNIIKHAGQEGTLLTVDVPESELNKYIDSKTIGDAGVSKKYGKSYFLPNDAPYTPNVIEISKCPNMLKKYF